MRCVQLNSTLLKFSQVTNLSLDLIKTTGKNMLKMTVWQNTGNFGVYYDDKYKGNYTYTTH